MNSPIRVVVADDEPDMRLLIRLQLDAREEFVVVGEAVDGADAVDKALDHDAHIVVMDLLMPGTSGFEGIATLVTDYPDVAVVAYTAVAGQYVRDQMRSFGVDLVLKGGDVEPLAQAIIRATAGRPRTVTLD